MIGSANNNNGASNWAFNAQTTASVSVSVTVSLALYPWDTSTPLAVFGQLAWCKTPPTFSDLSFFFFFVYFLFCFSLQLNWHAQVPPLPTLTAGGPPFDRLPNCNWNAKVLSTSATTVYIYMYPYCWGMCSRHNNLPWRPQNAQHFRQPSKMSEIPQTFWVFSRIDRYAYL